jgi:NTP pyrophosphatase (non-canonical NTP hydrolase)
MKKLSKATLVKRLEKRGRFCGEAQVNDLLHAIMLRVRSEVERAMTQYPTWPTDPLHALAVLGEENGELTKAMLQLIYEPHKTSAAEVEEEAYQTAAMAFRLILSLRRYRYAPCRQHSQNGGGRITQPQPEN